MAEENKILTYKGHPLMRKDNLIYYGSMADSHIIMLQILETKKIGEAFIQKELAKITNEALKKSITNNLAEIEKGNRDFRY